MESYEVRFLECLDLRGVSRETKYNYIRPVTSLASYYGQDPGTLSIEQVRTYFVYLHNVKHYSPQSLKSAYYGIRFFYIHVIGFRQEDFTFFKAKIEHKLPVILTREEVRMIISRIHSYDYRLLLNLTYQCGLRISEAVRIKIADINRELMTITVRQSKGNKDRSIPLPEKLYQELREYWKTHQNRQLLFPSRSTRQADFNRMTTLNPISVQTLRSALKSALKETRIPKHVTCHTLRHSYATHLLEAGVSIIIIKDLLGHESLRATMVYVHLTNVSREQSCKIINELMNKM